MSIFSVKIVMVEEMFRNNQCKFCIFMFSAQVWEHVSEMIVISYKHGISATRNSTIIDIGADEVKFRLCGLPHFCEILLLVFTPYACSNATF